jgi:hypothetical protein
VSVLVDEYDVDDVVYTSSLKEDLRIDRTNLDEEFIEHSSKYAWYSTAYELCLDKERRLKSELARAYAQLDVQARMSMKAQGIRVSEKKVENMVITSKDYVELQEEYFNAQRMTGLLKAARDAMIHKKECLISLGANIRAELASDPSLLQDMYKHKHGNK